MWFILVVYIGAVKWFQTWSMWKAQDGVEVEGPDMVGGPGLAIRYKYNTTWPCPIMGRKTFAWSYSSCGLSAMFPISPYRLVRRGFPTLSLHLFFILLHPLHRSSSPLFISEVKKIASPWKGTVVLLFRYTKKTPPLFTLNLVLHGGKWHTNSFLALLLNPIQYSMF